MPMIAIIIRARPQSSPASDRPAMIR
jgi:hypothetical protein